MFLSVILSIGVGCLAHWLLPSSLRGILKIILCFRVRWILCLISTTPCVSQDCFVLFYVNYIRKYLTAPPLVCAVYTRLSWWSPLNPSPGFQANILLWSNRLEDPFHQYTVGWAGDIPINPGLIEEQYSHILSTFLKHTNTRTESFTGASHQHTH